MRLSYSLFIALAIQLGAFGRVTSSPLAKISIGAAPTHQDHGRMLRAQNAGADKDTSVLPKEEEARGWDVAAKLVKTPFIKDIDDLEKEVLRWEAILANQNLKLESIFKQIAGGGVTPRFVSKELKIADKLATTKIAKLRRDGEFMMWVRYSKFWSDLKKGKIAL